MSSNTINFDEHQKLTNLYGFTLGFSLFWRELLLQIFPTFVWAILFALWLSRDLDPNDAFLYILITTFTVYILSVLLTNQYIINSLSRIKNKNFTVYLVKDNQALDKMGFYDSLCWKGSLLWRELVMSLIYAVIAWGIDYFQLLSESSMTALDRSIQLSIVMIGVFWVLKTKKTGRLVLLQPKIQ